MEVNISMTNQFAHNTILDYKILSSFLYNN